MKLPISLENFKEWTLVGPMGPIVPEPLVAHPLLCVDGGAHFCSNMDIWVGDGDSYQEIVKCENIFQFPPQKAASDLSLALSFFESSGPVVLHCWGFLGGRRDHELFNFGEVLRFLEKSPGSQVFFYQADGAVSLTCVGTGEWQINYKGTFSLASIKSVRIKLLGSCLYPLENETDLHPLSSLGLSNIGQGQFTLTNLGPVMIFFSELN